MSLPPTLTECNPKLFAFEEVERKAVVAAFDGGAITSNAGALLLGQVDRGLGLVRRFAACFTDRRDPRFVEHRVETLVGQRVFALALGYEDLNDHDELRKDPVMAVLAGKLSAGRADCEALAGKSTLNRLERIPKRHGAKYHKIDFDQARMDALLLDMFVEAHRGEPRPKSIVLDLDNTDIPLYGNQEADTITATIRTTVICHSTCSVAAICCWPGTSARTSRGRPARSRRSPAWSPTSAAPGRASRSPCAATAASPATR